MITPIVQRQMFQTINAEAVRAASEVGGLVQREGALRQALLERMAEDQVSVPGIPMAEGLRAEERQGGRRDEGQQHHGRKGKDGEAEEGGEANPAEPHMDFLA
jgi:hypothetical protein